MAIRFPSALNAKHILRQSKLLANQAAAAASVSADVPKGHLAVLCWREITKEEINHSCIILESSFISRIVNQSWGKTSDTIIQWVVSPFPAEKMPSLTSLLA